MRLMRLLLLASFLLAPCAGAEEEAKSAKKQEDSDYGVTYTTRMDFDTTLIEGKMKAPSGFFLQGRNKQSLSNMVNLRPNFKHELRNSRSGVKAIVH